MLQSLFRSVPLRGFRLASLFFLCGAFFTVASSFGAESFVQQATSEPSVSGEKIVSLVLGNPMLVLKADHTLWRVGGNAPPELLMHDVKNMDSHGGIALAVLTNGDLVVWGEGFGHLTLRFVTIMSHVRRAWVAGETKFFILKEDGSLLSWDIPSGSKDITDDTQAVEALKMYPPVRILDNVRYFSLSINSSAYLAVKNNGDLWGWGEYLKHHILRISKPMFLMNNVKSATVYCGFNGDVFSRIIQNDNTLLLQEGPNPGFRSAPRIQAKNVKDAKDSRLFRGMNDKLWIKVESSSDGASVGYTFNYPGCLCIDRTKTLGKGKDATTFQKIVAPGDKREFSRELSENPELAWEFFVNKRGGSILFVMDDVADYASTRNALLIVKNDGTLWGCGQADDYLKGFADANNSKTFKQLILPPTSPNVKGTYDR